MKRMYIVVNPNNYYCSTQFHSIIKMQVQMPTNELYHTKMIQINVNLHIISLHKDLKIIPKYVFYLQWPVIFLN